MTIDLSKHELELLDKTMDAYEKEAGSSAAFTGMLGMMLTPREERDGEKDRFNSAMHKASEETRQRRVQVTLLRAKLYQAMAHESEHNLTPSTTTPVTY